MTMQTSTQRIGQEEKIYSRRFSKDEQVSRITTWEILCSQFLNKYVHPQDTVLDLGAGDGHFIKNIKCAKKIAVDLSSHVEDLSQFGIEVYKIPASNLTDAVKTKPDVIFMSNFLEHLPDKHHLLHVLTECHSLLKPGGRIIILQPNVRYVGSAYWDYIDHHIALTEKSLVEALEVCNFKVATLIPRFLPYTIKSKIGQFITQKNAASLVSFYLKTPFLWRFFGQQTFVVAKKITQE